MIYIHTSALVYHGNLKSSNCVVTSRWMLQVTDFGLHDLRTSAENESIGEHQHYSSKILSSNNFTIHNLILLLQKHWCKKYKS